MNKRVPLGTRTREVSETVIRVTTELGRGAFIGEIRSAYTAAYGAGGSRNIDRVVQRLERSGELKKIGGRHRRTQWAHTAHLVPFRDPEDVALVIVEVVESLCRTLLRPVETHEVVAALAERGIRGYSSDQVRTRLESLAHGSERKAQRTAAEWAERRVRRIAGKTRGGRASVSWATLEPIPTPAAFRDASDAVRHAVGCAACAVGRPVTAEEVELWAKVALSRDEVVESSRTPDGVLDRLAAEAVHAGRFRVRLSGARQVDERRGSPSGSLRAVRTPLTSRGPYPVRYAIEEVSPLREMACLVTDLAVFLRPRTEMEGVARLREEAALIGSALLEEIATARETALAAAVLRAMPTDATGPALLAEACALADGAADRVQAWADATRRRRRANAEPVTEVLAFLDPALQRAGLDGARGSVRTIDGAEGVRIADLEGLGLEALALGDRAVRYWSPLIAGARRLRGPVRGGISSTDPSEVESRLDRPDTFHQLVSATHLPALSALVGSAVNLLGGVIRDPEVVLEWLRRAEVGDTAVRNALVVTLGLLGSPAPMELAWPRPGDPEGATAYLASVALGVEDEEERVQFADAAHLRACGAAVEITERALERIEAGGRLSIID